MVVINTMKYDQSIKNNVIESRQGGKSIPSISKETGICCTTIARWTSKIKVSISHPLYKTSEIDHEYFSIENLKLHPERMVLIGFIAADGCISMKKSKNLVYPVLTFNICQKDECILSMINNEIASGQRHISHIKCTNSLMLYFLSKQICNDLSRYNIVPRKTATYRLPELDNNELAYFLRGYFYGDGCAYNDWRHKRDIYCIVANSVFADELKAELVQRSIVDDCGVYRKKNPHYSEMRFPGKHGKRLAAFMFNDQKMILLPRKHHLDESQIT
jgi:hypothetical protein